MTTKNKETLVQHESPNKPSEPEVAPVPSPTVTDEQLVSALGRLFESLDSTIVTIKK